MIPGGESGPDFRPMQIEWVEEVAKKCAATNTALFVKQDASRKDGTKGRFKHFPHLWVREWPMPGPNDHQLRRFYRETEGKAKVMRAAV
jgi:protein gp37